MRLTKRTFAISVIVGLVFGLALAASANHPATTDHGTDIANTGAGMNAESFWESHFGGEGLTVECTKYAGHGGFIPAQYEAAVIKSGSAFVRVYEGGAPFTAIGPPNPNDQHPNRRHEAPFSWVMKCNIEQTTTTTITEPTTTVPEEPTTTLPDPTTTTPTTAPTTTSTITATTTPDPTTTTLPATTTSTSQDVSARWTASAYCSDTDGVIDVEWGDGIAAVDVYMWAEIGLGETAPGWGDRPITRYTQPDTYETNVGTRTSFLLIPVVQTGYTASPSEIEVYVEDCTPTTSQASSTSAPTAPQTPQDASGEPILPITGENTFQEWMMKYGPSSAMLAMLVGASLVVLARRKWGADA